MDTATASIDQTLDARGLSCPMPMLKTKKTLKNMASGQVLEVWSTDPGSKNDIPDFCQKQGNELIDIIDEADGYTRYIIKKG